MKRKYEFKNIVAETLLIPLYMRAKESRRKDAILKDKMAEQLIACIEYDYSKFDGAKLSEVGCVVRGRYFDDAVRRFIDNHTRPIVVNVGCGLDTRCQRIHRENDPTKYYELNLPEVISLRRELIPEPEYDTYISSSLLETKWLECLKTQHLDCDFIFIIEGVLMYFYEEQVKAVLHNIASRFSGGEIWFDVCGTIMSRHHIKPDSLRGSEAQIRSGLSAGHDVEQWIPNLQLIEQGVYQKLFPERWGWGGKLLGYFPKLSCKFSSMLGFRILK